MAEEPLPDVALVVRGGTITPEGVKRAADLHPQGYWGISVQAAPAMSAATLARVGRIPHGTVSVSTVGRISAVGVGFDVVPTSGVGRHCTLVVPSRPVSDADARAVCQAFDLPIPNPVREQRQP